MNISIDTVTEATCEYKGCSNKASGIAYSRFLKKVVACCERHIYEVADEECPEYIHQCENCGCQLPVN